MCAPPGISPCGGCVGGVQADEIGVDLFLPRPERFVRWLRTSQGNGPSEAFSLTDFIGRVKGQETCHVFTREC